MTSTAYRLTSTLLLLLAVALMLLAAEAFGAPNFRSAKVRANVPVVSSGYYTLPTDNQSFWQAGVYQGVPGGIDSKSRIYTNAINVTQAPYNADNTGATSASTAFNDALLACYVGNVSSNMNLYVYAPAGTYLLDTPVTVEVFSLLRGAGPTNTILRCIFTNGNGGGLTKSRDNTSTYNNTYKGHRLTAGLNKGSTNISITWDSTVGPLVPGTVCRIGTFIQTNQYDLRLMMNGAGDIGTNSVYTMPLAALFKVMATNATQLQIYPPLPIDFTNRIEAPLGGARAQPEAQTHDWIGVENLMLTNNNKVHPCGNGLAFSGIGEGWISNVVVRGFSNHCFYGAYNYRFEFRNCYFDTDKGDDPASNQGGLVMDNSSFTLIENNVILNTFPCIQHNGAVGDIVAYNYLRVTNNYGEDLVLNHKSEVSAVNLYEGNNVGYAKQDGYFGGAVNDTLFRNWIRGDISTNIALNGEIVSLKRWTRGYAMVGNLIGRGAPYTMSNPGTSYGNPFTGNTNTYGSAPPWTNWGGVYGTDGSFFGEYDTGVTNTLTLKGNYYFFTNAIPAAESLGGLSLSNSLYLGSKPAWFAGCTFPPFEPASPGAITTTNIPAEFRYVNGFWP